MATVDTLLVRIEADLSSLRRGLRAAQGQTTQAGNKMRQSLAGVGDASRNLASQFSVLKTAIAGVGFAVFGSSVLRANAEMEDLQRTLTSVFGTAEKGQAAFKFINQFAQETPFDIQTLVRAFIQLKGAGVQPTQELLTTLGNAASVTTNKLAAFESLVRITTRSVGGGLGLEELEQLVNQGIPVFKILEDRLNLTRLQVSEFGQSADGAAKIMAALNAEFSTNFAGAMADSSQNLSVQMSNLGIAVNNAFLAIGESGLNGQMRETIQVLTRATTSSTGLIHNFGVMLTRALAFTTDNFNKLVAGATAFIALKLAAAAIRAGVGFIQLSRAVLVASRAMAIAALTSKLGKAGLLGIAGAAALAVTFNEELSDAIKGVEHALSDVIENGVGIADDLKNFFGLGEGQDIIDQSAASLKRLEEIFIDTAGAGKDISVAGENLDVLRKKAERLVDPTLELNKEIESFALALENAGDKMPHSDIALFEKAIRELRAQAKMTDATFVFLKDNLAAFGAGVSDQIASALMNGKASLNDFKDFARMFVTDLISQFIRLAFINNLLNSILKIGGTSAALPTIPIPGVPTSASGGAISGPTIVGERGPELFVPSSTGSIKNNMDTNNLLGGSTTVVNQTLNIETGVSQTVRAEIVNLLPTIKQNTISAIVDQRRRGGPVASAFGA